MADTKPLSDVEVHERLVDAVDALGTSRGATTAGNTTLEAARRALLQLQLGLVAASLMGEDDPPTPELAPPPSPR
jgi:hypothetical protein